MADILTFASGSKIMLLDGKMFLSYGKKENGVFLITFEDIYKNVYHNEDTYTDSVSEENACITINRLREYDGEVLMQVDKIPPHRKAGNIYTVTFDAYETMIIKAIAVSIVDGSNEVVR